MLYEYTEYSIYIQGCGNKIILSKRDIRRVIYDGEIDDVAYDFLWEFWANGWGEKKKSSSSSSFTFIWRVKRWKIFPRNRIFVT